MYEEVSLISTYLHIVYANKLQREPTTIELFKGTHQHEWDNTWVDKKSEKIYVSTMYFLRV